jgi:ubiquitin-protein ligase
MSNRARLEKERSLFVESEFVNGTLRVFACPAGEDHHKMCFWHGVIEGPSESPYEGVCFELAIFFPEAYPFTPPRVRFIDKIYHPNIYTEDDSSFGKICLNLLGSDWHPAKAFQAPKFEK